MRFHPDKNPDQKEEAERQFQAITEAYTVLSDQEKRSIYDQGGKEKLDTNQTSKPNACSVFNEFFGDTNPFHNFGFADRVEFNSRVKEMKKKTIEIEIPIDCSLNELFYGCLKKVKVSRKRIDNLSGQLEEKETVLDIMISPGDFEGKRLKFSKEGDETMDKEAGDIIFLLREAKHPYLRRDKNDLHYTCEISLCDALTDCSIHVPTLSNRILCVPCPEILNPESKKVIRGEGMPYFCERNQQSRRGDLVVSFRIRFPISLPQTTRSVLKQYLSLPESVDQ